MKSTNDKLTELSKTVQDLKQILDRVTNANTDPHQPATSDPGSPLSQAVTPGCTPATQTPVQEMETSTISMDGFMFEAVDTENDLN